MSGKPIDLATLSEEAKADRENTKKMLVFVHKHLKAENRKISWTSLSDNLKIKNKGAVLSFMQDLTHFNSEYKKSLLDLINQRKDWEDKLNSAKYKSDFDLFKRNVDRNLWELKTRFNDCRDTYEFDELAENDKKQERIVRPIIELLLKDKFISSRQALDVLIFDASKKAIPRFSEQYLSRKTKIVESNTMKYGKTLKSKPVLFREKQLKSLLKILKNIFHWDNHQEEQYRNHYKSLEGFIHPVISLPFTSTQIVFKTLYATRLNNPLDPSSLVIHEKSAFPQLPIQGPLLSDPAQLVIAESPSKRPISTTSGDNESQENLKKAKVATQTDNPFSSSDSETNSEIESESDDKVEVVRKRGAKL